jgi:hypothetical protein
MKTKTLILGVVIAVISALTVSHAKAQDGQLPAVKIIPTDEQDVIKVIYGYDSREPVTVTFLGEDGIFFQDRVQGENLSNGFSKKYKVRPVPGKEIRVEVSSTELSVKYLLTVSRNGTWTAQLETTTYNYPVVAMK